MTFRFQNPVFLLLLIVVAGVYFLSIKRSRKKMTLRFPDSSLLQLLPKSKRMFWVKVVDLSRPLILSLLVLTMARPQSGETAVEIKSSGVDIVLAIDTSGSMQALDFQQDGQNVDRLTAVKKVVKDFVKGRAHDRIGMVVFGEEAFTQCPLTLDYGILLSFLDRLSIGMAGDATAIGSAIAISTKRLKDLPAKSKIVILLTDGRNNAGRISPEVATDAAAALGIRIYTIGAGTHGKAPFKIDTLFGPKFVYREVDIDEESLQQIAQKTGGQYFRATDSESLAQIYQHIDAMEKSEVVLKEYSQYHERFLACLLPALFLLLGNIVLSQTILKRFP